MNCPVPGSDLLIARPLVLNEIEMVQAGFFLLLFISFFFSRPINSTEQIIAVRAEAQQNTDLAWHAENMD